MTNRNIFKLFAGVGMLTALASCASDEPNGGGSVAEGGRTAFMTVNLKDVGAMATRADGDREGEPYGTVTNGTMADGTMPVECNIKDARFFFFNQNGVFVSEASVWNGGDYVGPDNDNISYEGKTVIVLKNLDEKEIPQYMLTVLNGEGFNPKTTLAETAKALELGWKNGNNFAMTTTSYYGAKANHENGTQTAPLYYANVLEDGNFMIGTPDENTDLSAVDNLTPIEVYVERLAAKVELVTDLTGQESKTYKDEKGVEHKIYKLDATVAGKPNADGTQQGVTQLYFEILGWDLNGTAKQSYFSKQLDWNWGGDITATGDYTNPWTNWNVPNFRRSYWGMSPAYGQNYSEATANYVPFAVGETKDGTPIYASADNMIDPEVMGIETPETFNMSGYRYCNERTNKESIVFKNGKVVPAEVTSIILKGRICDDKGNALDLVRGKNGYLYTKEQYLQYVLNNANVQNGLNVWYLTRTADSEWIDEQGNTHKAEKNEYVQVNSDMVKLEMSGKGTGKVKVVSALGTYTYNQGSTDEATSDTYYRKNADGTFSAYPYTTTSEGNTVNITAEDALTTALNITLNDGDAEAFTDGCSYYNIPIEHEITVAKGEGDNKNIVQEGYYGVVRNHWYRVTLKKIAKVGHGVFQPGYGDDEKETIIPGEPEDPAYYVTAVLRVLSWKRVNQEVNL